MSVECLNNDLHSDEDVLPDISRYISHKYQPVHFTRRPLRTPENTSTIFFPGFGRYKSSSKVKKPRFSGLYISPSKKKSLKNCKNRKSDVGVTNGSRSSEKNSIVLPRCGDIVDLTNTDNSLKNDQLDRDNHIDLTLNDNFFEQFSADNANNSTNEDLSSDEDLVVVSSSDLQTSQLNFLDIHNTIDKMVCNIGQSGPNAVKNLTAKQVAKKLKNLYNTDFEDRMDDIRSILFHVRKKYQQPVEKNIEMAPGIRASDLETLKPGVWLNDVIINSYLKLLTQSQPAAECLSSFLYEELLRNKTVILPENWIFMKWLLIPLCISNHWSLLSANLHTHTMDICNSMLPTEDEKEATTIITTCLKHYYNNTSGLNTEWKIQYQSGLPKQENSYDCGVYICMFARKILYQLSADIQSNDVTKFRDWMKRELINGYLSQ